MFYCLNIFVSPAINITGLPQAGKNRCEKKMEKKIFFMSVKSQGISRWVREIRKELEKSGKIQGT